MSLGFEQAGFDVLAAVEFDAIHAGAHHYNFPLTEMVLSDVATLSGQTLLEAAARGWLRHRRQGTPCKTIDVVFGGPSCQGFSTIGRRYVDDDRNKLIGEFVRLVTEIRPRAFCLENVPGILDERYEKTVVDAVSRLKSSGYHVLPDPQILNAVDFGVPQSRKRVFLIGTLETDPPIIRETETVPLSVADAFEGLPDPHLYQSLLTSGAVRLSPDHTVMRRSIKGTYARRLSGIEPDPTDLSRSRLWQRLWITNSLTTKHGPETLRRFADTAPGHIEPVSRYYRLAWDKPSRTLRAGTGSDHGSHTSPRPIHPEQHRVITAREAARIQSFPDWFRFNVTNWHGHRQIGNSVPPLVARAVASQMATHLGMKPTRSQVKLTEQDARLLTSEGIAALSE
jgi:DNA (cytosine-5)-methyltransferase 1